MVLNVGKTGSRGGSWAAGIRLRAAVMLAACVVLAGNVTRAAEVEVAARLPEGNPYKPAFEALPRFTGEDDQAIRQKRPLSERLLETRREVAESLAAGRRASEMEWGIDYAKGNPDVMPLMRAARISRLIVETLPRDDPERTDRLLDVMALGRHVGSEQLLILGQIEQLLERRAYGWWEKNIDQLSAAEARKILDGIEALPKGGTLEGTLAMEKKIYLDGLLAQLAAATKLLGVPEGAGDGSLDGLRMTGVWVQGGRVQIGFEMGDRSFWLEPGRGEAGVQLVSVNPGVNSALIRYKGRSAWLSLSSKRIAAVDLSRVDEALKVAPDNTVLAMLRGAEKTTDGAEALAQLERMLTEVGAVYEEARLHPDRFADPRSVEKRYEKSPIAASVATAVAVFVSDAKKTAERREQFRSRLATLIAGRTPGAP